MTDVMLNYFTKETGYDIPREEIEKELKKYFGPLDLNGDSILTERELF